jgi:hypothetical protein
MNTVVATPAKQRRAALETPVKATAKASTAAGFALPKTLAECADMAYQLREERYAAQKKVDEMKKRETALVEHLINNLPKSKASGVRGKFALATIKEAEVIELIGTETDRFEKVYDYILKNARKNPGVWSLLQRRVGDAAAKELILAGKGALIGAKIGKIPTVSLTKV